MQTIDPKNRLQVAVGVLVDDQNRLFMQQRPIGKVCEGLWEFPGGKIEDGETSGQALKRELNEELGIEATDFTPLMMLPYDYSHAQVLLSVQWVNGYTGPMSAKENQTMSWFDLEQIQSLDVLDAVHPILEQITIQGFPCRN